MRKLDLERLSDSFRVTQLDSGGHGTRPSLAGWNSGYALCCLLLAERLQALSSGRQPQEGLLPVLGWTWHYLMSCLFLQREPLASLEGVKPSPMNLERGLPRRQRQD